MALELDMKNDTQEYGFRKLKVLVTKILSSDNTSPMSVNICLLSYFQNQHALYKGHCDSLNVLMFIHVSILHKVFKIFASISWLSRSLAQDTWKLSVFFGS